MTCCKLCGGGAKREPGWLVEIPRPEYLRCCSFVIGTLSLYCECPYLNTMIGKHEQYMCARCTCTLVVVFVIVVFLSDQAERPRHTPAQSLLPGRLPGDCGGCGPQAQVHVRVRTEGGASRQTVAILAVCCRTLRDHWVQGTYVHVIGFKVHVIGFKVHVIGFKVHAYM